MSGIVNKIKDKMSSNKHTDESSQEQSFSIQPHPAKSNDPADLHQEPPQLGGGLNSSPEYSAHHVKGPYQPSDEIKNNMPEPKSREELQARAAQLNA